MTKRIKIPKRDSLLEDTVRTVTLSIGQLHYSQAISDYTFAEMPKLTAEYSTILSATILHAIVRYAEQKCEHVKYPANWWEAVKERFAPAWALKRWPVRYRVWEPFVIYPQIKLPNAQQFVKIRELSPLEIDAA
jgi:hypothetical protein